MASVNPNALQKELITLIKRLEAATNRLEDMAVSAGSAALIPQSSQDALPLAATKAVQTAPSENAGIKAFSLLLETSLSQYTRLSKEIGGVVEDQAVLVSTLFYAQRDFLIATSQCQKANGGALGQLLQPTTQALKSVCDVQDLSRERHFQNHLSTVSEGVPALGWVTVDATPGPYIKDMKESAEFYANRVHKEHKDGNAMHVDWSRSFILLLEELRKYVMQYHTTGLVWNTEGVAPTEYIARHQRPSAPSILGVASPPFPLTVARTTPTSSMPQSSVSGDMSSVFAQLNRGNSLTRNLKKADDRQQSHTKPSLRESAEMSGSAPTSERLIQSTTTPGLNTRAPASKKLPKFELEGMKWVIEHYDTPAAPITIEKTELGQTVNIYDCKSSVIQVKGKVNAISLVNCHKTSVLIESLVSALSVTSSPAFQAQITGHAPTITIDGTDGGQIYLGRESLGVEIISAKSTSINVSLPVAGEEEGVYQERPVPEQLKTLIKNGKLVTTVVEHAG